MAEQPPAGAWFLAAPLPHRRFHPTFGSGKERIPLRALVLGDGRVLVRGGVVIDVERSRREGGKYFAGLPVEEDDVWENGAWRTIPPAMADELAAGGHPSPQGAAHLLSRGEGARRPRNGGSMIGLDGYRVLVFAGSDVVATSEDDSTETLLAPTWVASPGTAPWQYAGDLHVPRKHGAPALLPDGRVMLAGGYAASDACDVVEIWEPMAPDRAVTAWTRRAIMAALAEHARDAKKRRHSLERAREQVTAWGEDRSIFVEELRAALATAPEAKDALADLLR